MRFDVIPTPNAEREPHFPTLEEIQSKMRGLMGRSDYKEERKVEDEAGIKLYEVTIVGEDGITCLYTYRKADGKHAQVTRIEVAYCNGSPDDNDFLPGGYNVSAYDEVTGHWSDTEIKKVETPTASTPTETTPTQSLITDPVVDETNAQEVFSELLKNEALVALRKQFDEIEALYTDVRPEETDFEIAKESRSKAKPLLDKACTRLIALNKIESQNKDAIRWNPDGDLTEEQFNELNLRRKKLANAVGMLYKNASGKVMIRHDLNDI